jgi:hypothetical protein
VICWKDRCYCKPMTNDACATFECPRHYHLVQEYIKSTPLFEQMPVAMADFSTSCEAYRPEELGGCDEDTKEGCQANP